MSSGWARLIYCDDSQVDEVEQAARDHDESLHVVHNPVCREGLHNNDESSLLIVTQKRLMRGFDYRAPVTGFALLIAKQLDSRRSYLQAIGRAGRNGERGSWFILKSLGPGYPLEGARASLDVLRRYHMGGAGRTKK